MTKIAVIQGDGTGPEVISEAVKCLKCVDDRFSLGLNFEFLPYCADRYLKTNETLSDQELDDLKSYDAILLGAIGDARVKPGILEREILLKIRFGLDQYINLRPVRLYENVYTPIKNKGPQDIDYVVVRENTGGLYTGLGGVVDQGKSTEVAQQVMEYSRVYVERCLRFAFDYALKRQKQGYPGRLTLCGKSNVLGYIFDLWLAVMDELKSEYSTITCDYVHVDACCIYMVESPERFDVIVTTNMFGDIITDLAAVTQGGMGVASGANINPNGVSMFEPIGGTAPDFTGQDAINPMAAIGAAHLMLDYLGFFDAAVALEKAKISVIKQMDSMAAAAMGMGTKAVGDRVVSLLNT